VYVKLTCSDNNEYYLHDDEYTCRNEMPHKITAPGPKGPAKIGAMGRMLNVSSEISDLTDGRPR
jgi:hypothetical protein